ncbi:hypothetical protein CRM22_008425 [Opisthorchis felineus]|uniref:Apple domain-containing protein n=1 Tax=Opisthorchis felineus TaxID=147828 RepID=A0A4S2LBS6_OPIFE|nr:hypothetical protein CRM22_008425 [Opisthorchis felineus]
MSFQHDYMIPGRLLILILLSEGAYQLDDCKPVKPGHVLGHDCKSGKFRWRVVENRKLVNHFMVMSANFAEVCEAVCETFPECGAFDSGVNESFCNAAEYAQEYDVKKSSRTLHYMECCGEHAISYRYCL